jgi:hypothetical protein
VFVVLLCVLAVIILTGYLQSLDGDDEVPHDLMTPPETSPELDGIEICATVVRTLVTDCGYWTEGGLVHRPVCFLGRWRIVDGHYVRVAVDPEGNIHIVRQDPEPEPPPNLDLEYEYHLLVKLNLSNPGEEPVNLSRLWFHLSSCGTISTIWRSSFQPSSLCDPRFPGGHLMDVDDLIAPGTSFEGWLVLMVNETELQSGDMELWMTLGGLVYSGGSWNRELVVNLSRMGLEMADLAPSRFDVNLDDLGSAGAFMEDEPGPGNRFVLVNLTLASDWPCPFVLSNDTIYVVDEADVTFEPRSIVYRSGEGHTNITVDPPTRLEVTLVFEMPLEARPVELVFDDDVPVSLVIDPAEVG